MVQTCYDPQESENIEWGITKRMLDQQPGEIRHTGFRYIAGGNSKIHYSAEERIDDDGIDADIILDSSNEQYSAEEVEQILEENNVSTEDSDIYVSDSSSRTKIDLYIQDSEGTHRLARVLNGVNKAFDNY